MLKSEFTESVEPFLRSLVNRTVTLSVGPVRPQILGVPDYDSEEYRAQQAELREQIQKMFKQLRTPLIRTRTGLPVSSYNSGPEASLYEIVDVDRWHADVLENDRH